jgi:hypothetical protein
MYISGVFAIVDRRAAVMGSDIKRSTAARRFPKSPEVSFGCWGICKFHSAGVIKSFAVGSSRAASSTLVRVLVTIRCSFPCLGGGMSLAPSATSGAAIKDDSSSPVDGRKSDTVEDDRQDDCSLLSFF